MSVCFDGSEVCVAVDCTSVSLGFSVFRRLVLAVRNCRLAEAEPPLVPGLAGVVGGTKRFTHFKCAG